MIDLSTVNSFFEDLASKGDFNTSKDLTWGFFFLSSNVNNLRKLNDHLIKNGYEYVDLFDAEKEDEQDEDEYYLLLEKIEKHTPITLDKRNQELYRLAEEFDVEYDGFDVGHLKI